MANNEYTLRPRWWLLALSVLLALGLHWVVFALSGWERPYRETKDENCFGYHAHVDRRMPTRPMLSLPAEWSKPVPRVSYTVPTPSPLLSAIVISMPDSIDARRWFSWREFGGGSFSW